MRKSKFTDAQIAFALKQVETGTQVKEVVRKLGITEQSIPLAGSESTGGGGSAHRRCVGSSSSRMRTGS
jgi:putative transposase